VIKQGYILNKSTFTEKGKTFVELWVKTREKTVRLVSVPQQPTCFVAMENKERLISALGAIRLDVSFPSNHFKTLEQIPVVTVKTNTESQMHKLRKVAAENGITLYEADIRLADRYLMERFIYGAIEFVSPSNDDEIVNARIRPSQYLPSFSWVSIDIECDESETLFSISIAGENHNEVILVRPPTFENKPLVSTNTRYMLTVVDDEKTLLNIFFSRICSIDPDIILGWNVKQFDFAVIARRANCVNEKQLMGRHGREATTREWDDQVIVNIPGRCIVDGIEALKTMTYHFDSFTLDNVAEQLLNENKLIQEDDKLKAIKRQYLNEPLSLADYNFKDSELVNSIQQKTQFIDFLTLRGTLTGLELGRPGGSVAAFLNVYLPKLHREHYVAGVRPSNGGLASPGGYVMRSLPGLYDDVLVLDFKSLYPSIIRTFNIDPLGLAEGLQSPETAIPGFKGAVFSRTKHFLPDIIKNLWSQRDEAKRQNDKPRSQAIKIIMNSFYGVLGSGGCPFYDPRLASSITLRGHDIMQTTAKWIEELGYTVIYGDTDSTFVHLNDNASLGTPKQTGQQLAKIINQKWQSLIAEEFKLTCELEIEFESHFTKFFMPTIRGSSEGSKKRYAGIRDTSIDNTNDDDGTPPSRDNLDENDRHEELVFKGLENVRSDWTQLAKDFQYELYSKVFKQQPVKRFIRDTIDKITSGDADQQLIYKKRLRKPLSSYTKSHPPHVKAAILADKLNAERQAPLQYQRNRTIAYVITLNGPQTSDMVRSPLDYNHYIDKQIRPIAESILPLIGLDFNDIVNDQLMLF
jgi:DNA polymerase-2